MKNIVELYWIVDEVVKRIEQKITKKVVRGRKNKLRTSELITMALIGHFDNINTDKKLYEYITMHLQSYFNNVPCYEQFTRGIRSISYQLDFLLEILCQMNYTSEKRFYIVDSTALPTNGYDKYECPKWACEVETGKNIFGFYHGFKLHLIINRSLEVVSFLITPANVHDVKALYTESFIGNIKGMLVGDKGYIAPEKFLQKLKRNGLELLFKQRENMDPYLNEYYHPQLRQRQVIEGVFSYLKNRLSALHKFARSTESFLAHVKAALAAFMLRNLSEIAVGLTI
jgi:hypothetical protein